MENQNAPVMSVKDWAITVFITALPIIGFIMLFVWAFGSGENPNKQNWAKGTLIIYAIFFVLSLIFVILFSGALLSTLGGMNGMDSY